MEAARNLTPVTPLTGSAALWRGLTASAWKELVIMSRYPVQFIASFGQVFLIVAIFTLAGSMFRPLELEKSVEVNGVVIYGFILFIFLSDTLWTLGFSLRQEQLLGTLEQLYLSPANKFANLAARVINLLTWTLLVSLTSMALMGYMLGGLPVKNVWLAIYIFVLSLSGTFGVGFAFAGLTMRIKETASTLINLIQFAFLIFCANFFPFSALPEPMLWISRAIPLAYSVDAFRSSLMGFPAGYPELASIEVELVIITAFGLIMPILGYLAYRRAEGHARRTGGLSEY